MRLPNLVPVPGVKLGLANIVTVFAVYHYRAGEAAMIVFCRVVLGAFFGGSMLTLLYSLAGALLCLAGMLLRNAFWRRLGYEGSERVALTWGEKTSSALVLRKEL